MAAVLVLISLSRNEINMKKCVACFESLMYTVMTGFTHFSFRIMDFQFN